MKYIDSQLDSVKSKIEQSNIKSAIYLCRAIHENLISFYNRLIYENYQVEQIVDNTFQFLKEIGGEDASPLLNQNIYEYTISLFQSGICNQTPWFVTPLSIAAYVASSEKEIDHVLELADTYVSGGGEIIDIKTFKYLLIQECKCNEEADKYVFENIDYHYFRKIAIEKLIDEGDYDKAVQYAKEGVELFKKRRRNHSREYENILMKLYKKLNNREELIRLAQKYYISGDDYVENYKLLKMLIRENKF